MDWSIWRPAFLFVAALAVATVATLGFRGSVSHQPPREFAKGMWVQAKAKAQAATPVFADGRVNRMPPAGAIPWGSSSLRPDPSLALDLETEYARARMPVPATRVLLARGKEIFTRFCALCHGAAGNGRGVTTRFGMNPPPNYADDRIRAMGDGEIFRVITEGKNTMGPLRGRIAPADRWAAIAWVRVLQHAGHASLDDVPEAERKRLLAEGEK